MECAVAGYKGLFGGVSRWLALGRERKRTRTRRLRILALVAPGPERQLLKAAARDAGARLNVTDAVSRIVFQRASDVPPIVLLDRSLVPDLWRAIVRALARTSPRPYVILLSPTADANLWDELQRVGGSDLVRSPFQHQALLEALERAGQLWRNQQVAHGAWPRG
jgi:FixJ family two-component response regulator